jgi:pimeloyl-ACP methyl ester carboxylesterase
LNALSSRYRVVAVDLRGHGRSDKPSHGYTLGYLAEDIHEVIGRLRLERTFIVGWSMGGSVLFEYLRKFRGEYLKGAVFVDIGPYSWKTGDYPIGYSDYEKRLELTREYAMAYQDPKNDRSSFISRMFIRKPSLQVLQDFVGDYYLVPSFVRSLLIIELYASDYRSLLPRIEVPTLIVTGSWGGEKGIGSTGEYMHNHIKKSTYIRFSESGHCPFVEEPERFNRVLSEFVEANSSPRGGK